MRKAKRLTHAELKEVGEEILRHSGFTDDLIKEEWKISVANKKKYVLDIAGLNIKPLFYVFIIVLGFVRHFAEAVKAQLGPGLHTVSQVVQFGRVHKGHLGNHLLSLADLWCIQNPVVNDSEMDAADLVGVVIEQGDNLVGVVCLDGHFFGHFALDGGEIIFV